jgi:hypothetical protein
MNLFSGDTTTYIMGAIFVFFLIFLNISIIKIFRYNFGVVKSINPDLKKHTNNLFSEFLKLGILKITKNTNNLIILEGNIDSSDVKIKTFMNVRYGMFPIVNIYVKANNKVKLDKQKIKKESKRILEGYKVRSSVWGSKVDYTFGISKDKEKIDLSKNLRELVNLAK